MYNIPALYGILYVKYKQTPSQSEKCFANSLNKRYHFQYGIFSQEFFFSFSCLCFSSWCIKCFLYVYSINEYKKMDILTCCLLSKKFLFCSPLYKMCTRTTNNFEWQKKKKRRSGNKKKKLSILFLFHAHYSYSAGIYTELADMSFIFVFNTVEEAFTDDWIFRYFLSHKIFFFSTWLPMAFSSIASQ